MLYNISTVYKMTIKVFYHIYCNQYTLPIVREQITKIIFSGLYEKVFAVYCFVTGEPQYIDEVCNYIQDSGTKFKIPKRIPYDTTYERYTLLEIPNYITPEDKFLYIHSKGVTKGNDNVMYPRMYDWRTYMEYFLIGKHVNFIDSLDHYDVAGVNLNLGGNSHYSGNFWWSTGRYYLTLNFENLKNDSDYFAAEMFLFKNNPNPINFYSSNAYHYEERYPMYRYIDLPK